MIHPYLKYIVYLVALLVLFGLSVFSGFSSLKGRKIDLMDTENNEISFPYSISVFVCWGTSLFQLFLFFLGRGINIELDLFLLAYVLLLFGLPLLVYAGGEKFIEMTVPMMEAWRERRREQAPIHPSRQLTERKWMNPSKPYIPHLVAKCCLIILALVLILPMPFLLSVMLDYLFSALYVIGSIVVIISVLIVAWKPIKVCKELFIAIHTVGAVYVLSVGVEEFIAPYLIAGLVGLLVITSRGFEGIRERERIRRDTIEERMMDARLSVLAERERERKERLERLEAEKRERERKARLQYKKWLVVLQELIANKRSVSLTEIAQTTGLSVERSIFLVHLSDFSTPSSDQNTAVNLRLLGMYIDNLLKATGRIDPSAISQEWNVAADTIHKLVIPFLTIPFLETTSGDFLSIAFLRSEMEKILREAGRVSPLAEAEKRGLQVDEVYSVVKQMEIFETEDGDCLHKPHVIEEILKELLEAGILNIVQYSQKLGVKNSSYFMREIGARLSTSSSCLQVHGTSLFVTQSWLEKLRQKLLAEGMIELESFAQSIGLTKQELEALLSRFVLISPESPRQHPTLAKERSTEETTPSEVVSEVVVQRGAEFVGNELVYKVKVTNNSLHVITDVTVSIISYPRESLRLDGSQSKAYSKLESGGFRSAQFKFLPTQDCVRGDVLASVSYVDSKGRPCSETTEPYTIRAVCDLLVAESISPENFELSLSELKHGEMSSKIDNWTPEEMYTKTVTILRTSNFFQVSSKQREIGEYVEFTITGWARGKYTGKKIGVEVTISGKPNTMGSTCKIIMSGEDEAMIMPAIDEVSRKLHMWLCPMCSGKMPIEVVDELRAGRSAQCPFCGVAIDR